MLTDYTAALAHATQLAISAGQTLRGAFHDNLAMPGKVDIDAVDREVERELRDALRHFGPNWPVLGEEDGLDSTPHDGHLWVIDPHDGTEAAKRGWRGPAVSIGVLRDGRPVLGVVFAYAAHDDRGDLIAWAEGCGPVTRNGVPVARRSWAEKLDSHSVIAVSQDAARDEVTSSVNAELASPARFLPVAGIAWRLARVAVGDADAAVSLGGAKAWDVVAAHALLRAVGAELFDEHGRAVHYSATGGASLGSTFAGSRPVVDTLRERDWKRVFGVRRSDESLPPVQAHHLRRSTRDAGLLSRAQGAMLGQLAGDALGSLVEFRSASWIARQWPTGPYALQDGGTWDTIAGQPTDDSEMALALARSLASLGRYDAEDIARAYAGWYASGPFDIGGTTRQALAPAGQALRGGGSVLTAATAAASTESQANGALMRVSPLGVFGHNASVDDLAAWARLDASITHPHAVCQDASALFAMAIAHAVSAGSSPRATYDAACTFARRASLHADVQSWLAEAETGTPDDFMHQMGWVRIALQNAFWQLLHAESLESGVVDTVRRGGDTDTNAAIAGALLGAVHGRDAVPAQWRKMVETCRATSANSAVRKPRPAAYWPSDVLTLAERLVVARPGA